MAVVRLSDVYEPLTFNAGVNEAATERNAFLAAGILATDATIVNMANVGGTIGELPFYKPLSQVEPNYSTDDPAVKSTPQKVTSAKQIFRKAMMNQSWSTMDLARELALADPLGAITSRVGHYWATQIQRRVIQSAMGVLADNVANDGGDMVVNVATDASGTPTAAEKISAELVLMADQTMGDAMGGLTVMAVHSVIYTELRRQNLIQYIPNARGEVNIPTYLGKRLIVDDGLPAVAGTNRITYTSILFAPGAFAYGQGTPTVPSEVERVPDAGNGGGQEILYTRRTDIIHPYGFQFTSASVAGESATLAELANGANWNRVVERKNVGMVFIKTNG